MSRTHQQLRSLSWAVGGVCLLVASSRIAPGSEPSIARLTLSALCVSLSLAAFALAGASLLPGRTFRALGLARGHLGGARAGVVVIGTLGLSHLLDWLIRRSGLHEGSVLEWLDGLIAGASGADLLPLALGLAVAPGVAEELLFRGLGIRALTPRFGAPIAIAISSGLFGVLHLDVAQALGAATLGLYLGTVAIASGGVRLAIACHVANNLTGILNAGGVATGGGLAIAAVAAAAGIAVLVRDAPARLSSRSGWWSDETPELLEHATHMQLGSDSSDSTSA